MTYRYLIPTFSILKFDGETGAAVLTIKGVPSACPLHIVDFRPVGTTGNAMQTGQAIHREVGTILDQGNMLSSSANNYFKGANGTTGRQADLSWGNTQGGSGGWGVWADLTTPLQWGQHVTDYTPRFGEGIPLLYQAGTGLTNLSPLYSGAGAGLTALQFGTDSLFGGSASGGFILYPNKPNNNAMQSVYRR